MILSTNWTARATEDEDIAEQVYEFKFNKDTSETKPFIQHNSFFCISLNNLHSSLTKIVKQYLPVVLIFTYDTGNYEKGVIRNICNRGVVEDFLRRAPF